jgi:alkylhydroperoxidase/carboxymuconolactone decarboxylase family protein YurZ
MKPNQTKILKFGLNYGVITGFVGILFMMLLVSLDMLYDKSIAKALAGLVVLVVPIVFAIVNYKKLNGNSLSVGEALGVGMVTAIVAGLISLVFTYILTNFIIPDYWDVSAANNLTDLKKQFPKMTVEQLNDNIASQRKLSWITYPFIVLFNMAIGFIVSFIAGISIKTTERF